MTYHEHPTTYAEVLENLTEENWHTARELIENEVRKKYPELSVYVVVGVIDYGGDTVLAVYDDELKAFAEARRLTESGAGHRIYDGGYQIRGPLVLNTPPEDER